MCSVPGMVEGVLWSADGGGARSAAVRVVCSFAET